MSLRISFWGAVGTVTGSRYLLEWDRNNLLVDAGLFQGPKKLRLRNWVAPQFDPSSIEAVFLTHAHIDHSGYLPALVKYGFRGPIYCTLATAKLLNLLLPDAAYLQEEDARYHNKKGTSRHKPAKPLFDGDDAKKTLRLIKPVSREKVQKLHGGLKLHMSRAGHILGAVSAFIEAGGRSITFSGDLGRYNVPILADPRGNYLGDVLLVESTYGDRLHDSHNMRHNLAKVINEAIASGGPLIIPAFAIGRTQYLLYELGVLEREGLIPELPVIVDSPMAIDATKIYQEFRHDFDEDAQELMKQGIRPLVTAKLAFSKTRKQSIALNHLKGPRIIISASGMVTGGRILHHLTRWLPDENASVLFVGYQAYGTRGRDILGRKQTVKIFGKHIPIRARVSEVAGLSAHGDKDEMLKWLYSCHGSPDRVYVVHGEKDASVSFAKTIAEKLNWESEVPAFGMTVEV